MGDIGETILLCMDVPILSYSVESMPNKKSLSENEYEFVTEFICFCLLQSYYDVILQKRKDKPRQVIEILFKERKYLDISLLLDALKFHVALKRIREVFILTAKRLFMLTIKFSPAL